MMNNIQSLEEEPVDDLELYPGIHLVRATRDGLRTLRANWRQALAVTLVMILMGGVAGYRWVTHVTPMDRSHALDLFRAQRDDLAAPQGHGSGRDVSRADDGKRISSGTRAETRGGIATGNGGAGAIAQPTSDPGGAQTTSAHESGGSGYTIPEEGVYSWATDGYEQVSGARRQFPEETQRIITLEDDRTWTQHHYFSEEREIWTRFHWGSGGVEVMQQRNKVTFGPVTNESQIDFSPPMLVAPRHLKVGYEWGGEWTGATHGTYSSKIVEHTHIDIGGERVEVWGMAYVINLHGEQEGQVKAEVWLAPAPGLTVKEHYVQDVESNGAQYHAEWMQTLKSLHPQQ
jgi:hypothetical protein